MKTCINCNVTIEDSMTLCPRCSQSITTEEIDACVHKLLTEANLHRIRGDYNTAIDNCTDVLRMKPDSPEVHSMLGDIYESSGNLEESAKWYQMAIDLRPESAIDAAKLDRLRTRLQKSRRYHVDDTTGSWSRVFLGEEKPEAGIKREIIIISIVSIVVLLAFGMLAWFIRARSNYTESKPIARPPASKPAFSLPVSTGQSDISNKNDVIPMSLVRPSVEQKIFSILATSPEVLSRHLVVEDVNMDPRNGNLTVTFRLPEYAEPITRQQTLKNALVVASEAFIASTSTSTVTVRALATFPGKLTAREPRLVLIGEAARQVSGLDLNQLTEAQLQQYFSNLWWGPELQQ